MPTIIATKEISYGGKLHAAGARFEATDQHARVLTAVKKASLAADEAEAEPEESTAAASTKAADQKAKGTYRTRDLKAK